MAADPLTRLGDSVLDSLGILQGTDKSSLGWDYLRHFERELSQFRDQTINVIEVGVAGGSSLRTWTQFFSLATIVGIDINPNCKRFANNRVKIEIGSQADAEFLATICRNYPPTIVIDDGSHQADHIRFTFEHVFPCLANGGCYIVEDLHFHFSPPHAEAWRGSAAISPQDYFGSIANKALAGDFSSNVATCAPASIVAKVDRIAFLPRAVVIWKSDAVGIEERLDRWEALAVKTDIPDNWARIARRTLEGGGSLDRAKAAAMKAITLEAHNWNFHYDLARVLECSKDFSGAYRSMQDAIERCPAGSDIQQGLTMKLQQLKARL